MGSHLIGGKFQSDKYGWCLPDFVPLKTTDKDAQPFLWGYAQAHRARDEAFSSDLETALKNAGFKPPTPDGTSHDSASCLTPSELRAEAEKACPCDDESCGLVMACEDHTDAPVRVKYLKNQHTIVFACSECERDLPSVHLDEQAHAQ
jgi:hypothetical protein